MSAYLIKTNRINQNKILIDNQTINTSILSNHIDYSVQSRIANKNPSTDRLVYSTQDPYYNGIGRFIRNPTCWINDVTNISCFSPAQLSGGSWNTRAGTLITRKHVIFARHYTPGVISGGTPMLFVDDNNNVIRRNLIRTQPYFDYSGRGFGIDITIGLLDSEVPSSIKIAKVLPKNFTDYFPPTSPSSPTISLLLYGVALDQEEKALVKRSTNIEKSSLGIYFDNFSYPDGSNINAYYNTWGEAIVTGDSGNPVFYIIDNELVLITTWYSTVTGSFVTAAYDEVCHLIEQLSPGEGYSLTPINLHNVYNKYK